MNRAPLILLGVILLVPIGLAQSLDSPRPVGTGRVSGRVLSSSSTPIGDAIVRIELRSGEINDPRLISWWTTTTIADGSYSFDNLPTGRFTVVATKEGFLPNGNVAVFGGSPVDLVLQDGPGRQTFDLVPGGHASERNLTVMARAETDEGPVIGLVTITAIDGPNDIEVVVGRPGSIRGRVVVPGNVPLPPIAAQLVLVREGLTPLGARDDAIALAPDGSLEADELLGEHRVRVDQPQSWTVKAIHRRGVVVPNNRLVVRNAETLDDLEILLGPR